MNTIVEFVILLTLLSYLKPEEPWGLIAIGAYVIWKPVSWVFMTLLAKSMKYNAKIFNEEVKKHLKN